MTELSTKVIASEDKFLTKTKKYFFNFYHLYLFLFLLFCCSMLFSNFLLLLISIPLWLIALVMDDIVTDIQVNDEIKMLENKVCKLEKIIGEKE